MIERVQAQLVPKVMVEHYVTQGNVVVGCYPGDADLTFSDTIAVALLLLLREAAATAALNLIRGEEEYVITVDGAKSHLRRF